MNYYIENDPKAAAWLRHLIVENLIPLAHGFPERVGLLRGFGNAINPWLAARFIKCAAEAFLIL